MSSKGFTLIEMLIVIAIIGILMSTLLPSLLNSRKSANDASAGTYLRNMITMSEMKRSDNGDIPVYNVPTACAPTLSPTLPDTVTTCQFRQDANTSYGLVKSKTGNYFLFDGSAIQGPLTTPPASW